MELPRGRGVLGPRIGELARQLCADTVQRRFLETPGQIITTAETITVRLNRRAYSPVLRQADLPDTTVPWWGNRTLHYEYA